MLKTFKWFQHEAMSSQPVNVNKIAAFTLAEVLITLSIIGVVAAITMPTLVQQKNNNEIKARVNKAFSTLSNAVELAKAQNGDIDSWNWTSGDASKILDIITPSLSIKEKCVSAQGCFPNTTYKKLNDTNDTNLYSDTSLAKARLADGSAINVTTNGSCDYSDDVRNDICGNIAIDVNGDASPNKWGYDMFKFNVTKEGVVPYKAKATCSDTGDTGEGCAANIVYDNNFSYMTNDAPMGVCACGSIVGQPCTSDGPGTGCDSGRCIFD